MPVGVVLYKLSISKGHNQTLASAPHARQKNHYIGYAGTAHALAITATRSEAHARGREGKW